MIRERVARLLEQLAPEPQYPTQGATLFVDLERAETARAYTPRSVVESFLEGRGANMVYLYHLLDPSRTPLDPEVPLQLSVGLLTGIVPSAARGQITSWSPESGILLDSNAGDFVPSFMKLQGIDRFVLYGRARGWTYLYVEDGSIELRDATAYVGLDNLELRRQVARDLDGRWGKDLAMANITRAGELGVRFAAVMGGRKALWARGGPGAKMGSLHLKAIVLRGFAPRRGAGHHPERVVATNRELARQALGTSVVRNALSVRGTPFLYRPSRLLGALGAKNHQESTWTAALDAENIDPYRTAMTGCFRCPVRCRPVVQLGAASPLQRAEPGPAAAAPEPLEPHASGEGPDYVTVGKLGAMVGLSDIEQVIRLNHLVNDLGLDSASLGSALGWAMELYQRRIIDRSHTGGLALEWGDFAAIEQLVRMTARREGFGDVVAEGAAAVELGKYPPAARRYCMAVKGLMQSDPHDARIIKAFALGLAVATRGMDHLRNRATLEINARINDDTALKERLYGGPVAAEPTAYEGKEHAVRACEDLFAVGDAVGLCRFTTRLFNSPNLPGLEEIARQLAHVTGLELSPAQLGAAGRNIIGLERMINHSLGVRRADDTLPDRWFDEPLPHGPYAGERVDRQQFEALLARFYTLTGLDAEGQPALPWRAELVRAALGFAVTVRLPPEPASPAADEILVTEPVHTAGELCVALARLRPSVAEPLAAGQLAVAINGTLCLVERDRQPVRSGDRVELVAIAGGG